MDSAVFYLFFLFCIDGTFCHSLADLSMILRESISYKIFDGAGVICDGGVIEARSVNDGKIEAEVLGVGKYFKLFYFFGVLLNDGRVKVVLVLLRHAFGEGSFPCAGSSS